MKSPVRKSSGSDDFPWRVQQIFKELTSDFPKSTGKERLLPNSFQEASISLMGKPGKNPKKNLHINTPYEH